MKAVRYLRLLMVIAILFSAAPVSAEGLGVDRQTTPILNTDSARGEIEIRADTFGMPTEQSCGRQIV
jgi:hypothetical protein